MALQDQRRILMISTHGYVAAEPPLGHPDTGGQVVYVLELSKSLARLGWSVDIFTRRFDGQRKEEFVAPGVRICRFPCGEAGFIPKEVLWHDLPEWVDHALTFIRGNRLQYQMMDSHYWDAGYAGEMLSRELGIPHIHTPHSLGVWKRNSMQGSCDANRYEFEDRITNELKIYHGCEALIATTRQQSDLLTDGDYLVPSERVHVIPPGFADDRFFPATSSTRFKLKKRFRMERPTVAAVGRLARNKGYDLLIRAMLPVVKRIPDCQLILAVGGRQTARETDQDLDELKDLAASIGLARHVDFRDHVPEGKLADFYRAADAFALSSRYEPFGMTAIEAMACGTPTVVTTEGGLWEELNWGQDALYANPNDTESFGFALLRLLQLPRVARQISEQGAAKVAREYSWRDIARRVLAAAGLHNSDDTIDASRPVDSDIAVAEKEGL